MKKLKFLSILLLTGITFSCKKKDDFERGAFKVIGDEVSSSIYYQNYDPPLEISDQNREIDIMIDSLDVDGDGIDDVEFTSRYEESKNYGYNKFSTISNINKNLQFQRKMTQDTLYSCTYEIEDTFYKWEYRNSGPLCFEEPSREFIDGSDRYLAPLKKGDIVYLYDLKKFIPINLPDKSSFLLSQKDSSKSIHKTNSGIIDYYFIYRHWDLWNDIGEKYLFFRIVEPSLLKYGWIKLEITDVKKIIIYEITCFETK